MRIFVTGSADGLGKASATTFLKDGHDVIVHIRHRDRVAAVQDLLELGAKVVIGDLADPDQTLNVARQANALGRMDAVIHNAGVLSGPAVMPVNVVAAYLLTASMLPPDRLVYLSSDLHRNGHEGLGQLDWSGRRAPGSYSDSKLFVTTLSAAVARLWPMVFSNAIDPGWVPTRMGGESATDDLLLGHLTQEWLATSSDPEALTSGGYWHHQRRVPAHPAVHDERFQDGLLESLAAHTGVALPATL